MASSNLEKTGIHGLTLTGNFCNDDKLGGILERGCENNKFVKIVHLNACKIGKRSTKALTQMLQINPILEQIHLSNIKGLTSKTWSVIFDGAMKSAHHSLEEVILERNFIKDKDIDEIIYCFRKKRNQFISQQQKSNQIMKKQVVIKDSDDSDESTHSDSDENAEIEVGGENIEEPIDPTSQSSRHAIRLGLPLKSSSVAAMIHMGPNAKIKNVPLSNKPIPLMKLNLSHNKIGNEGACCIAKWLLGCLINVLRELNLEDNSISDVGVEALAKGLSGCICNKDKLFSKTDGTGIRSHIKCEHCPQGNDDDEDDIHDDMNNAGLYALYLGNNRITHKGAVALAQSLLPKPIKSISNFNNEKVNDMMMSKCQLKVLSLNSNHIGMRGAVVLSEAIQNITNIHKSFLRNKQIEEEFGIISSSLPSTTFTTNEGFKNNSTTFVNHRKQQKKKKKKKNKNVRNDKFLQKQNQTIYDVNSDSEQSSLESDENDSNNDSDEDSDDNCPKMKNDKKYKHYNNVYTNLEILDIRDNCIGNAGYKFLNKAVKAHPTLKHLYLQGNGVGTCVCCSCVGGTSSIARLYNKQQIKTDLKKKVKLLKNQTHTKNSSSSSSDDDDDDDDGDSDGNGGLITLFEKLTPDSAFDLQQFAENRKDMNRKKLSEMKLIKNKEKEQELIAQSLELLNNKMKDIRDDHKKGENSPLQEEFNWANSRGDPGQSSKKKKAVVFRTQSAPSCKLDTASLNGGGKFLGRANGIGGNQGEGVFGSLGGGAGVFGGGSPSHEKKHQPLESSLSSSSLLQSSVFSSSHSNTYRPIASPIRKDKDLKAAASRRKPIT